MFHYNILTDKLLLNRGSEPIARLDMEAPAFEDLTVAFFSGTDAVQLPSTAEIRFGLKSKTGTLLALTDDWTKDPRTGKYSATLSTTTAEMTTAMGSNAFIDVYAQMVFRESPSADPQTSQVITVRVHKSQITFSDGTPTALPDPEEWLVDQFADAPAKSAPVDADTTLLTDSEDEGALKKVTFLGLWNYIAAKAREIFIPLAIENDGAPTPSILTITGSFTNTGTPFSFDPLEQTGTQNGRPAYGVLTDGTYSGDYVYFDPDFSGPYWFIVKDDEPVFGAPSNAATPDLIPIEAWFPGAGIAGDQPTLEIADGNSAKPGQPIFDPSNAYVWWMKRPDGSFAQMPQLDADGYWRVSGQLLRGVTAAQLNNVPKEHEEVYVIHATSTCVGDGTKTVAELPWTGTHRILLNAALVAELLVDFGSDVYNVPLISNASSIEITVPEDIIPDGAVAFDVTLLTVNNSRVDVSNLATQALDVRFAVLSNGNYCNVFGPTGTSGDSMTFNTNGQFFTGFFTQPDALVTGRFLLLHTNATIYAV